MYEKIFQGKFFEKIYRNKRDHLLENYSNTNKFNRKTMLNIIR